MATPSWIKVLPEPYERLHYTHAVAVCWRCRTQTSNPKNVPSFIVRHARCEERPSQQIAPEVDGLCKSCDGALGDEQILGAHPECLQDDTSGRCRSCGGGDDRYCPCTTGYSSSYFTRDML